MKLQQSGEDYLETIYLLYKKNGQVRSVDIAKELSFSKASVSRAIRILRDNDFIIIHDDNLITLTEIGEKRASEIYDRHKTISIFFEKVLKLDKEIAVTDACKVEHVISQETFEAIKEITNKLLNK